MTNRFSKPERERKTREKIRELFAKGLTRKVIAERLGTTRQTIRVALNEVKQEQNETTHN